MSDGPTKLAAPPRELPRGVLIRLLTTYDVLASNIYLVPAAILLLGSNWIPAAPMRVAAAAAGVVLLALALQAAVPALVNGLRTAHYLRYGLSTVGVIVACRLPWESKRAATPYGEFLKNWPENIARSSMSKALGCLTGCVLAVFFVPVALVLLAAAIAVVVFGAEAVGADFAQLAWFAGGFALFTAVAWGWMHFLYPRLILRELKHVMEGAQGLDQTTQADLLRDAKSLAGEPAPLMHPLPEKDTLFLVCRAEYALRPGKRLTGEGTVRLRQGLDVQGVERLLCLPWRPHKIVFFAGLPDCITISANGGWEPAPAAGRVIGLVFTGLFAAAALYGLTLSMARMLA